MSAAPEELNKLLRDAQDTLSILRVGARRAFVLEVTGTPKAGKTSTLGLMHGFFRRAGYKVHTLKERASTCPIPMKGHFFFNAWTTCTMLAEVLATHDTDVDIIILDRGFFDALIWLNLQQKRGQITDIEASTFKEFVLLDRWRSLVDLTVVMTVTPEVAMSREHLGSLLPHKGSLMNPESLADFNAAVNETELRHRNDFRLLAYDNRGADPRQSATRLITLLLPVIRAWAEQNVLVAPRDIVRNLFNQNKFLYKDEAVNKWSDLQPHLDTRARHDIEKDDTVVQIVGCGIAIHENSLFLFTRTAKDEKSSYGRSTLWKGCHAKGDLPVGLDLIKAQTLGRLLEELHLREDLHLPIDFWGMAWTDDDSVPESRHLGVFFAARIEDEFIRKSMEEKEFRKAGRGNAMVGKFQNRQQILQSIDDIGLEPWSRFVVQNVGLEDPE